MLALTDDSVMVQLVKLLLLFYSYTIQFGIQARNIVAVDSLLASMSVFLSVWPFALIYAVTICSLSLHVIRSLLCNIPVKTVRTEVLSTKGKRV